MNLLEKYKSQLISLCEKYNVNELSVFGSILTNEFNNQSDVDFVVDFAGTVAFTPTCTWVTAANLVTYLGVSITNPSDDYTLITQAVSAGNQFCSRRRAEAGYNDSLSTSPSGDVTLGTLMYCAALWRSRGSLENVFASFEGMGSAPQQSLTPIVKQLLGIDRPAVA